MGEAVRAIVEPAGPVDDEEVFARELVEFCRERLSRFKCPTSVALVGTLPRLPTGKIAKRLFADWLREPYAEGVLVESDLAD
jgi:acyl-CoA synthetase (AMP-forming)/AMP-acid ligase II